MSEMSSGMIGYFDEYYHELVSEYFAVFNSWKKAITNELMVSLVES